MTKESNNTLWNRNGSGSYIWTIEHIFPEGENIPQEWVDMIADGDKEKAKMYLYEYTHRLGNLTMTGYNSTLSNLPFEKKRDRRDKQGNYVGEYYNKLVSLLWNTSIIIRYTDNILKNFKIILIG